MHVVELVAEGHVEGAAAGGGGRQFRQRALGVGVQLELFNMAMHQRTHACVRTSMNACVHSRHFAVS